MPSAWNCIFRAYQSHYLECLKDKPLNYEEGAVPLYVKPLQSGKACNFQQACVLDCYVLDMNEG